MSAPAPRAVVVTGGAQGIGRAIAERFLADGASVVIADLDGDLAAATAAELATAGPVRAVTCDVSNREDVRRAVRTCAEQFGRLDAMIAHAGIADVKPLLEIDDRSWQRVLDVNLTGVFLCMQEAGRVMAEGAGGAIVVTASTNSFWVEQNMARLQRFQGRGRGARAHGCARSRAARHPRQRRRARRRPHAHLGVGDRSIRCSAPSTSGSCRSAASASRSTSPTRSRSWPRRSRRTSPARR